MPTPDVDAERLIDCLVRHEVAFVVVGGFAVELWNVPIQPTVDVDITPEQSKENLARLATALHELKAELRFADESVPIPGGFTADNIADMNVMNLITTAGPLDLTIIPAGTDGYPDLIRNAAEIKYESVMVPTAALEDVARSKEAAGRAKDIRALPAIRAHMRRLAGN